MKALKMNVNVNVRLSGETMDFISALMTGSSVERPIKVEKQKEVAAEQVKKEEPKSETKKEVAKQPDAKPVGEATKQEEKKEETAAVTSGVTLEQVRKVLGEKINDFRPQIREKLTSLGAKNISTVSESDYDAFYKFLNELK